MQYGIVFPQGMPAEALELAELAEATGWDAFFSWEAVWGMDAWTLLGAVAARTQRIRLGTLLTPVSRRRPWKLASETATLDQLSGGRTILAVGLGAPDSGFPQFGEETDRRLRAERLDEGLEILTGLWAGQPFAFEGKHYRVQPYEQIQAPPPVQQPRIPIWVVGAWPHPKSMERVARYDGLLPNVKDEQGHHRPPAPDEVRAMQAWVEERRTLATPFDIILEGTTPGDDPEAAAAQLRPLAEAGATWWIESPWEAPNLEVVRERVRQGPPRV